MWEENDAAFALLRLTSGLAFDYQLYRFERVAAADARSDDSVVIVDVHIASRGELLSEGLRRTAGAPLAELDGLRALILPAITLGVYQLTLTMRLVRSEMQDVMKTDFIKFAIARGIDYRTVHYRHALRNSMVPVITIIGLQFGGIIAFSIVTESVFQWPGMGLLFLDSIRYVDIPVLSVYLVLIALIFVIINLIVDILYFVIDPRVRLQPEQG